MVKIIFFIETLGGGGAEKVLLDIVKSLDKNKYDITVKTIVDNGVYDNEIKKYCKYDSFLKFKDFNKGIISRLIYYIKYYLIHNLNYRTIYKILFKENFDIEIAFVEGYATKVIGNSCNKESKKIAWVHVDPIERDYADKYFNSIKDHIRCYKTFNKIVCVSESVKLSVEKKYGINDDSIITQYNPIDVNNIKEMALVNLDFNKKQKLRLISIGRLVNQKGYDRLIRVINKLRYEIKDDFELLILGDGECRSELEEYISSQKLNEIVRLIGFVENPYNYIASSDLFICSSRAEGFSLVIAEALVLGVPVISTKCSGPNELLNFGEYGMLVNNNEEELYLGLKNIISNSSLLEELKKKAIKRASSFNYIETINQIENNILLK